MKLREVSVRDVAQFGRIPEQDDSLIPVIMAAAQSYVLGYTGLTLEQTDAYEDLTLAYLVLCCEMYDNRNMTTDNDKVNPYVKSVLAMHAVNYL